MLYRSEPNTLCCKANASLIYSDSSCFCVRSLIASDCAVIAPITRLVKVMVKSL